MRGNVKLIILGDFCSTPSTDHIKVSDDLKELISSCDIKICNFESPVKPFGLTRVEGRLYQSDSAPKFLSQLGFNYVSLANNHTFDYGDAGYLNTVSLLKENGIECIGAGSYDEAYKVVTTEFSGMKVGLLALSFASGLGVFDEYSKDGNGCAYIGSLQVPHIIKRAKKDNDILIILPHDGIEYVDVPTTDTRLKYRNFIDLGADAVIGNHPHCPQGLEIYNGKPIFYSLGNFFFNSKTSTDFVSSKHKWYNGLAALLTIDKKTIKASYVCTLNIQNKQLVIDSSTEAQAYIHKLNNIVADEKLYYENVNKIIQKEGMVRVKALCRYYQAQTLQFGAKYFLANIMYTLKYILKRGPKDKFNQIKYLQGDTERELIIKALKHN